MKSPLVTTKWVADHLDNPAVRIGERSSHTWVVLKYILGYENVRNYDGSWTEWGNLIGNPIAQGEQP